MQNNKQEQNSFSFTYSAAQQAEIKKIRARYTAPTEVEDKMARLRRLDASVSQTAQAVALAIGVIGTLLLGTGMSLCMTDFAKILGAHQDAAFEVGILVGILGGVLASLAYPVYNAIVKARRKRLAPEILRLTDELMK